MVSLHLKLFPFLLAIPTCPPYSGISRKDSGHFEQTLLGNNYHSKKAISFAVYDKHD